MDGTSQRNRERSTGAGRIKEGIVGSVYCISGLRALSVHGISPISQLPFKKGSSADAGTPA